MRENTAKVSFDRTLMKRVHDVSVVLDFMLRTFSTTFFKKGAVSDTSTSCSFPNILGSILYSGSIMKMHIENAWTWTVLLLVALCNRVAVHGFVHTGSESNRDSLPALVNAAGRRLGTVTPPLLGANYGGSRHMHRPLQVINNNGDNSNEKGVYKQEEQQNQQPVSKIAKAQKPKKKKRFAVGDELKRLRSDLDSLRENLHLALAMEDDERVADLKSAIQNGEQRDPDLCYAKALQMLAQTKASTTSSSTGQSSSTINLSLDEKQRLLEKWQKEAEIARSKLPQFQLEGLWVGK